MKTPPMAELAVAAAAGSPSPPEQSWQAWRALASRRACVLVDARTDAEYRTGQVPGALSLPLLDAVERHEVGLRYQQQGRSDAVALGLEIFAAKVAEFNSDALRLLGPPTADRLVGVHCWRGGMRSRFTAFWLRLLGYNVTVIAGGYRAYRQLMLHALDDFASRSLLVLDGRTGAGKSELIRRCLGRVPTVDFEGIARHRGSAFGDFAQKEPVPTQQNFENQLAEAFLALGEAPRILVEIENLIGPLALPRPLREKIVASPVVLVERDFEERVERLATEYAAGWGETEDALFAQRCEMLRRHVKGPQRERIIQATQQRDFHTATRLLLELRYDTVYDKGLARRESRIIARFNLTRELDQALRFILDYLRPGYDSKEGHSLKG